MKIILAPDSFKGSLSAFEVCKSIEKGIRKVFYDAEIVSSPMADGGEGTVQSLVDATNGKLLTLKVKGPLLKEVDAFYGMLGDGKTAVIEMASASGITLITKEERNPMLTTTYGTGEIIKHALDLGCRNFILGIGGSATNDGGAGMVNALGAKLLDEKGYEIDLGGGALNRLQSIDLSGMDARIKQSNIEVACDVNNPLCGENGTSYIFGPQKGADMDMVITLDKNLSHYAEMVKKYLGISIKDYPGAGAAGGLGGGLFAFLNAKLKSGIDIVIETTAFEEKLKDADLVITGEGMIDYQTQYGKTPYGVAKLAKKYDIPVIAIAGGIGENAEELYSKGFDSIFSIVDKPMSLEHAIENCDLLLQNTAERIMRLLKIR
ncbi:MAG TPA: glycerate kinase [Clostridiaceae bacterium]